ncbi:MAG: hypothetical protein IKT67_08485 [Lachnospiraceae bacterium]|nr:hypothetical protein [Lachnospiraceae bacterium]
MSHLEDSTQTHSAPQKLKNARSKQRENVKRTVEVFEASSPMEDDFPDIDTMQVSSATELTGMMYRPPITTAELESYHDLYDIQYEPAAAKQGAKDSMK